MSGLSRRGFLGLGGLGLLVAGCGSTVAEQRPGRTVTDKFGQVTIPTEPRTIASVGRTDHDALLALGIVPTSVYQFVPTMRRGVGVWAEPKLGAVNPALVTAPLSFEKIAALRPDLILDVQSSGDPTEYRTLSAIAPTIGLPPNTAPNTVSWQDSTRLISTAVGRAADGDKLVTDTEQLLERTKSANPSLHGRTISILLCGAGEIDAYTTRDVRTQLAVALGMVPSPFVLRLDQSRYYAALSAELVNDSTADVILVLTRTGLSEAETLNQYPMLASPALRDRVVVVEDFNVSLALACASVLSIPYAIAGLVPLLIR
ncbi:ABC transporter substrate-binding protein [Pseudonocardia spinosispora]|uniref:ABC transporter substrate-binding protein n=1 Tax=Pseudonocardia spinosispora TaxID=103441 RepID=UPI000A05D91A|nr:ABC transporter substrate-binding protein [Pseudonocardia spinosispora]